MKNLISISLILLILPGLVYAKEFELKKDLKDYEITLRIDRNPPSKGKNNISISILDKNKKPLTDAEVTVEYGMPPMPGMPPMDYRTGAKPTGNEYTSTLNFSMSGPWYITIKIHKDGISEKVKFNIDVR